MPVQHCALLAQARLTSVQAQVPPEHCPVQHSPFVVQLVPVALQAGGAVQIPLLQVCPAPQLVHTPPFLPQALLEVPG